jgi:phosphinothricin acetyltransferase
MHTTYHLGPITGEDQHEIMEIFNYYVEHSWAAYPEERLPDAFFSLILEKSRNYPTVVARDRQGGVAGFGLMHPHNPMPVFARTAEITYFVRPGLTGKGIGKEMLASLEDLAKGRGISNILANISSKNEGSIRFHQKNGFVECGRIREAGEKKGVLFDLVWMQKLL